MPDTKKMFPVKKLKLMGQTWNLIVVNDFLEDDLQGLCTHADRTIRIRKMARDAMIDTLFHEVNHAYQEMNPISLPDEHEDKLEYLAQWNGVITVDFIKNNKKIIQMILDHDE